MANRSRNSTLRSLAIANDEAVRLVNFVLADIVIQSGAALERSINGSLQSYTRLTKSKVLRYRERGIRTAQTKVANEAIDLMVKHYKANKKQTAMPYRYKGDRRFLGPRQRTIVRYSNGALERAFSNRSKMYRSAMDGLDFIDPTWLDSQAKQWYRINFGAGKFGNSTPKGPDARVRFFNQETPIDMNLGLRFAASRKPMLIPQGKWRDKESGVSVGWDRNRKPDSDFFYPQGRTSQMLKTVGFPGIRYLDVGVAHIAKNLPKEYAMLVSEYFTEFQTDGGGPVSYMKADVVLGKDINRRLSNINRIQQRIRSQLSK